MNTTTPEQINLEYCRNRLRAKIHIMITNDLTIGREDVNLHPYSTDDITIFINNNFENIELVINDIINAFSEDEEGIEDLRDVDDMLADWIGEFLYERITTLPAENENEEEEED